MTSNAASTPPATADVPSPRGDVSKVVDTSVDDAVQRSGSSTSRSSETRDHHPARSSDSARDASATAGVGVADTASDAVSGDSDSSSGTGSASGVGTSSAPDASSAPASSSRTDSASSASSSGTGAATGPGSPSTATATSTDQAQLGPDPAGLHGRMLDARERLRPEGPTIPAPRSPQGVAVPPTFGGGTQPKADIVAAIDQVIADLAAIRTKPYEPAHHALVRLGELTAGEIPDAGWSRTEGLDPDVVAAAADLAQELHTTVSAVLERLDAEELLASAVVVDSAATSLQVIRMVADLEVFARSRG